MPTLCTVSGTLKNLSGETLADTTVGFYRKGVSSQYGDVVVNYDKQVTSNGSGFVSFGIYPGTYTGTFSPVSGRTETFTMQVPETAAEDIADLIGGPAEDITTGLSELRARADAEEAARISGDDAHSEGAYYAGPWDASTGAFPAVRGAGGAVQAGDYFDVSVAGTVDGQAFEVDERIKALIDAPSTATLAANWYYASTIAILEPLNNAVDALADDVAVRALDYGERNFANATALVGNADGVTGFLGGLQYTVDASAAGSGSATNDLLVDGLVPFGPVYAGHFGFSEAQTSTQRSASMQAAGDFCLANGIGKLRVGSGSFTMADQVFWSTTDVQGFDLIGDATQGTEFVSEVVGDVLDQATDGYLFVRDGFRNSVWRDFTINYAVADDVTTAGRGGIVEVCLSESAYSNALDNVQFIGGTVKADRETNTRRSYKVLGQQVGATATTYAAYFNKVRNCNFNIAYTHIEAVVGNSGNNLDKPNAVFVGDDNKFERYIVGVNFNDVDECTLGDSWFQQGQAVTGINDDRTDCVYLNGSFITCRHKSEAGTGARPYSIGPDADRINMNIINNNPHLGVLDAANSGRVFVQENSRIEGLERINAKQPRSDLNIFGDGSIGSDSATPRLVRIWRNNESPNNLSIGYSTATGTFKVESEGKSLDLRPTDDANDVIVADSAWDASMMRLGGYYFWVDGTQKLRMKFGAPTSDTDGDAFAFTA